MKLSFRLHKKADFIFDYLTNMQKFVSVHPIIFQIDQTGTNHYLVHETLKLGFIPFSFTYPVTVEKNSIDNVVFIRATVFRWTKIEMAFVLVAEDDYTTIEETILFKTFFPIQPLMNSIFRKQHQQLFKNIELLNDKTQSIEFG